MSIEKIRVVVDTNIFISMIWGSLKAQELFDKIIFGDLIFLTSYQQLNEIKEVLKRSKFSKLITKEEVDELIFLLRFYSEIVSSEQCITDCRDLKDNMILEIAVDGNSDYIITGDKDLLVLNPYRRCRIVTLSEFLE